MTTAAKTSRARGKNGARANGKPDDETLAEAIAYEDAIRAEADALWTDDSEGGWAGLTALDGSMLRQLRPLLRKPIPTGFIEHVGEVTGKPYESTGVKSVQVQMDRLDNVLGPQNWGYESTHSEDGKRCYVRAWIGTVDEPLATRDSWGGVKQGSSDGNIFKGSFTNAAKLALARLGPGWEVYVGAADFDPDTDADAAKVQASSGDKPPAVQTIAADRVAHLMEAFTALPGHDTAELKNELKLKLGSIGVSATGIGSAFAKLTPGQADEIDTWISDQNGGAK